MEIKANTKNPKKLVEAINGAIQNEDLKTWSIVHNNKQEELYSHTPEQWNQKAMLLPSILDDSVDFMIVWWRDKEPDEKTKGYILGRFIEILMVHFIDQFDSLTIYK